MTDAFSDIMTGRSTLLAQGGRPKEIRPEYLDLLKPRTPAQISEVERELGTEQMPSGPVVVPPVNRETGERVNPEEFIDRLGKPKAVTVSQDAMTPQQMQQQAIDQINVRGTNAMEFIDRMVQGMEIPEELSVQYDGVGDPQLERDIEAFSTIADDGWVTKKRLKMARDTIATEKKKKAR